VNEAPPTGSSFEELVLALDRISADMLPLVGGKAANLGELTRAGFPVPRGLCLATEAYRHVVGPALLEDVFTALSGTEPVNSAGLAALADRARQLVLGAPVPPLIADTLRAAYAGLGPDVAVAVRSSATAEDLPFASFAGQQDTYLNVVGVDDVLDAVRRCWASLWTERAVSYRATNGIDHSSVTLAVVVQEMVEAEVAGVLFTANPLTGRRREAVIDANPGLGEAVVSGAVNPDHFVVDTATGEITQRLVGSKRLVIRGLRGGGTERIEIDGSSAAASLDDEQIRALSKVGDRVQSLFGAPQDIEWAIGPDGTLWLTQSRPITTLFPVPRPRPGTAGERVYLCFTLAQGLTRPITPMGLAAFRLIISSVARTAGIPVADPLKGPPPAAVAGQRLFIDITAVVRSRIGRDIAPRVLDVMETRSAVALRTLFDDPRFSVTLRARLPLIRRIARTALHARVPATALRALVRPDAARRAADRTGQRLIVAVTVPEPATPHERLDRVQRILGAEVFPVLPRILPLPVVGFAMLALARRLVGNRAGPDDWQAVLRGLPHNVTTEMDLALWEVATRIRSDLASFTAFRQFSVNELADAYASGALPDVALAALASFLGRFGHRAVAEIDVGMPRWFDDPTHIVGVLANYLRLPDGALAPDEQFRVATRDAEARVAKLVAAARARGRIRGALVRFALRRSRALAGLRELPKYLLVVALAAVRSQLIIVGTELARAGRIGAADDVFYLDLVEARNALDGADLHGVVAERRAEYERELRRRHIPRLLLSDGTEVEALQSAGNRAEGDLSGTPASAGVVTGIARVILDPVGARLEPGEILVAPSTDPGWTPLFLTAGGLVMEMGGANSHGAVVAREYGIPAVVGVADATSLLVTGQRIRVDGASGTVAAEGSRATT
jgi:phosphohistidine swiveling domain-containing protein